MSQLLCLNSKLLHHVSALTESFCETYLLLPDRVDVTKQAVIRSRDLHPSHLSVISLSTSSINSALYILIYIQQDATLRSLIYLETALHVSGGTTTYHQEHKQLYLQHLVSVTPLLLSATIVEELELVWVCYGLRMPPTAHSNQFKLFYKSSR
jgi:hypothetical protein